jgi:hypothetical protein
MEGDLVGQLERAAEIMMASPQIVTADQRQQAEQIFVQFGKMKCPCVLYQQLLEASQVSYVQFQAMSGLKRAVVRDWQQLTPQDADSLRAFLTNYVLQNPSYECCVFLSVYKSVPIIVVCLCVARLPFRS